MVAKGFNQIPGLDFTDNVLPVVNDVTFRVVITCMIIEKWEAKILDTDNTFLNREMEHETYMAIPEGVLHALNNVKKMKH